MDVLNAAGGAASPVSVRRVRPEDGASFLGLVVALAEYEHLPPPDAQARARLLADAFSERPRFEAYLAEYHGKPVGYSIILETYSSFLALPTLYLEDIFVLPEYRKRGVGRALFATASSLARERGCGRMDWVVIDWNEPAHRFYRNIGAKRLKQWELYRLTRDQLENPQ
jgi:GNAT superfamily N-acetyltransferase